MVDNNRLQHVGAVTNGKQQIKMVTLSLSKGDTSKKNGHPEPVEGHFFININSTL